MANVMPVAKDLKHCLTPSALMIWGVVKEITISLKILNSVCKLHIHTKLLLVYSQILVFTRNKQLNS